MSSTAPRRYTVAEYLERELAAETKSEFYDGEIFAMAGASRSHNTIVFNLAAIIHPQLRGGPCQGFPSDMRTRLHSGLYTYPDVIIVCGKQEFARENADTLVNPTAAIEVLSPSTQEYDTGRKFRWYQETPSIQEIVFVSQKEPRVQIFRRDGSSWKYNEAATMDKVIQLQTGGVKLPLLDVYLNVDFTAAENAR